MPIKILKKYVSPWALPEELIVGKISWAHSENIREIQISCPAESETALVDVLTWKKKKNRLIFNVQDLELDGKFGFISKIKSIPKKAETRKEFRIMFLDEKHNVLVKETLRTKIIRPMLIIQNVSPQRVKLTKDHVEAVIKLELKGLGWGDILKVRPKIEADAAFLEIVEFKPAFITDTDPFMTVNVEKYIDRILVKRAGKTKLSISFIYEDRIGNIYETRKQSIGLLIQQIVGVTPEIFVENKLSIGKKERTISRQKTEREAWPLVAQ